MEPFLGMTVMFAGNFAPRSWAFCDGQLLPISQNSALFSILGTAYGGDGRSTFALPDLRGRTAVHPGNGPGLSTWAQGAKKGTESNAEVPHHTHTATATVTPGAITAKLMVTSMNGTTPDPADNILANAGALDNEFRSATGATLVGMSTSAIEVTQVAPTAAVAVTPQGALGGVNNIQPSLGIYHIIAIQGTFPSRS